MFYDNSQINIFMSLSINIQESVSGEAEVLENMQMKSAVSIFTFAFG